MLYIAILYKVMKQKGIHEDSIAQAYRLYNDFLLKKEPHLDHWGRIRLDNLELKEDVQKEVTRIWKLVNTDNLLQFIDLQSIRNDFFNLFGFN